MNDEFQILLAQHPFLHGLSEKFISYISVCARQKTFKLGDYLFRYQNLANQFFMLLEGSVLLLNNIPGKNMIPLETIVAPNIVGWSWMEPPYQWHFDAKAQSEIKCLSIQADNLRIRMLNDKEFGFEMYRRFFSVVVDRLQASRIQSMDVYAKPAMRLL